MPQEIRWPENVTGETIPEVVKMLGTYHLLSHPSVTTRGLQSIAVQAGWPDMNVLDAELFLSGLFKLDEMNEVFKPKRELPN